MWRGGIVSPEIEDYLSLLRQQRKAMLAAVAGLPVEALDWTPLPRDTSSLAMLAHHCAGLIRLWFVDGLLGRDTGRNREAEFAARGQDAATLAALINAAFDEAEGALAEVDVTAMDEARPLTLNHAQRGETHSGRYCIIVPLRHVAEHTGHMALTRQLWEARTE
jgi:Protein of unknown function (DUF664)